MADLRENAESLLATVEDIDLNQGGLPIQETLFTCPAGKTCIITKVVLRSPAGAGLPASTAEISFGWNAGGTDVIDQFTIDIAAVTNYVIKLPEIDGDAVIGAATDIFKMAEAVAEGAALTVDIDIFGFLY